MRSRAEVAARPVTEVRRAGATHGRGLTPAPPPRPSHLVDPLRHLRSISELGLIVVGDQSLPDVLQRVARLAVEAVDGVDEAAVVLHRQGRVGAVGYSGRSAAALDERAHASGFGPALETARTGQRILVASTEAGSADGFEAFAVLARREGITSVTCLPLSAAGRAVGGLVVYGRGPEPMDGGALELLEAFAAVAGAVVASAANLAEAADMAANLRAAMESRAVIERAKGVLMSELRVGEDEAFAVLRERLQETNRKVRDIATEIVAGPGDDVAPDAAAPDAGG